MATTLVVRHSEDKLPIATKVLAGFLASSNFKIDFNVDKAAAVPELSSPKASAKGDGAIAIAIAKLAGVDNLYAAGVETWVGHASVVASTSDGTKLLAVCEDLTHHLTLRSFFVGYNFTVADFAIWGALADNPVFDGLKRAKLTHLMRWYAFCNSFPQFQSVAAQIKKKAESRQQQGVFHALPGAEEGKVITRFPPEPSGFLHIGHCKAAMLNAHYARMYKGKLVLRFDDTNPSKEKDEYVANIKRDLATLGITPDILSHSSDLFDLCLEHAEKLIKKGLAYCDASTGEEMNKQRMELQPSPYRNTSVEENLRIWNEMKAGSPEGKKYLLRAKIDYASKNGTMRDPGLYRVVLDPPHLRTGNKYRVYPLYDMVCPIVDSTEGVTHAMRSSEYHDRDEQYYWLLKAMELRDVKICDFSRLNFEYQLLSKRKLQWFVDNGLVEGWDDPRFPTIQGMMRRGLTKEALWEFILAEGASKNTVLMEMSKLWAINKRLIDPEVPRYWAVNKAKIVKMTLEGAPTTPEFVSKPRHKKNEKLGMKTITYTNAIYLEQEDAVRLKDGEEVTLMDWGNAIMTKIHRDDSGAVKHIDGKLHLAGDFKTTEHKLTWLPCMPEELVDVKLVEFGNLITKKSLQKEDNFIDYVNKDTVFETRCLGDPNLRNLQKGERIQLERRGYFICEQPLFKSELILYQIPDGRESGPSHISTKKAPVPEKPKNAGKKTGK